MNKVFRAGAAASLALLATGAHAQAVTQETCVTSEEMSALLFAVTPRIVETLGKTCTPALPANAYLRTNGGALAARFAAPAAAAKPGAMKAFARLGGGTDLPVEMFDIAADAMIGEMAVHKIKPQDCPKVDRILALLDPLPPENLVGLISAIIEFATQDEKSTNPVKICKPA